MSVDFPNPNSKNNPSTGPVQLESMPTALEKISHEHYEQTLNSLQRQLLAVQAHYFHQKKRAVVVFEGWDASGKGGVISRLTEKMDPRGFAVHAIGKPDPAEQSRHYLFRFWNKIPEPGKIVIFDRSWYGRVLVERVEGLCSEPDWQRAYAEINHFERLLQDDGINLIKIFLHLSPEEQLRRFYKRYHDPLKSWKLTLEDFRNRDKWPEYVQAINSMLRNTSEARAPWQVIGADRKKPARLRVLEILQNKLSSDLHITQPQPCKELKLVAEQAFTEMQPS